MQYVCDAGELTWFRIETEGEAVIEASAMEHAVDKYFKEACGEAVRAYPPPALAPAMEQNIGLKSHIARVMPCFLTLRDSEGTALVTVMLPPEGQDEDDLCPVIVGKANSDPYPMYSDAIAALAAHYNVKLEREICFPYRR